MSLIYTITNPLNEVYVGSTKRSVLNTRINEHRYRSKKGRRGLVYDSFRRFGFGNHTFSVLCEAPIEDLIELEHFIIEELEPKLNIVKKYNNTAQGKVWVNNGRKEFQILPNSFKDYNDIKKGRLTKKI